MPRRVLTADRKGRDLRYSFEEWAQQAAFAIRPFYEQTLGDGRRVQVPDGRYISHANRAATNGVVQACVAFRQATVSSLRFAFQRLGRGGPSDLFDGRALRLLERPWPGGTTQDLLARLMVDVDLGGNSYWTTFGALGEPPPETGEQLLRLAPDQVDVIVVDGPARHGVIKAGYLYYPDRHRGDPSDSRFLTLEQVAHVMPIPDPHAEHRGMSWLTPVMREVYGDDVMTDHRNMLFSNAATPNIIVKHPPERTPTQIREHAQVFADTLSGARNAGKTAHISGVDLTVVGLSLKELDYRLVQAAGAQRITAAAGIPAALVGLEADGDGPAANLRAIVRRYSDITLHTLGMNIAGSLQTLIAPPVRERGARLMYDPRDVPILRADAADEAAIVQTQIAAINAAVMNGFEPTSAVTAVLSGDLTLLRPTGLISVQLYPPGSQSTPDPAPEEPDV